MEINILTWNVRGDSKKTFSTGEKIENLGKVLKYWQDIEQPVNVVVLQETAGTNGELINVLNQFGFNTVNCQENIDGSGRGYTIGVSEVFEMSDIQPVPIEYEEPANSPTRNYIQFEIKNAAEEICHIITLHGNLGARRLEGLEKLSEFSENIFGTGMPVIIAGDFNAGIEELSERIMVPYGNPINLFPSFDMVSNGWDHILVSGLYIDSSFSSEGSPSDHNLLSAQVSMEV